MEIASIKYGNAAGTLLAVTLGNGFIAFVPWPCRTWQAGRIQAWLDAGNTIEPAQAPTPPPDQLEVANIDPHVRALGLVMAQWCGKTPAQLRQAFRAAMETLS